MKNELIFFRFGGEMRKGGECRGGNTSVMNDVVNGVTPTSCVFL